VLNLTPTLSLPAGRQACQGEGAIVLPPYEGGRQREVRDII